MNQYESEHDIQNNIRLTLTEKGYCVLRINVGKVKTADGRWFDTGLPKGTSDLLAIKSGKAHWIEVKCHTGKPRPEQIVFIKRMKELGCNAGLAYSVEDAIEICEGKIPESNKKWLKE